MLKGHLVDQIYTATLGDPITNQPNKYNPKTNMTITTQEKHVLRYCHACFPSLLAYCKDCVLQALATNSCSFVCCKSITVLAFHHCRDPMHIRNQPGVQIPWLKVGVVATSPLIINCPYRHDFQWVLWCMGLITLSVPHRVGQLMRERVGKESEHLCYQVPQQWLLGGKLKKTHDGNRLV